MPEPPADDVAADDAAGEDAAPDEAAPEEPETSELDPSMLESDEAEPQPKAPPPTARRVTYDMTDPDQAAAKLKAEFDTRYRPADNPARLNVTGRLQFINMGGSKPNGVGGRMGGASVDIGAAWNRISVAGSVAAYGGRFLLPEETGAEMNAMFGGGPTLGYGRSALLGRGYLDFRIGYDFYYGVVGARRAGPTVVASQADGETVLTQTENLSPHGPRVRMDLGLLSLRRGKYFHGFGLSMGYQGLVHTFRGDLPYVSILTLGLAYWMG